MARRRVFTVFSLSFLDIMSCGFGAVILVFVVIHHSTEATSQDAVRELAMQADIKEKELARDQEQIVEQKKRLKQTDEKIASTRARVRELIDAIRALQQQIAELEQDATSKDEDVDRLKQELRKLEDESTELKGSLAANDAAGRNVQSFSGEGDRQYLTGIKMGGQHILLLLDRSSSMLDETIVNVIRQRNLPDAARRGAAKWQRAIRTVEWITANIPHDGFFQLYTFSSDARPALPESDGKWLETEGGTNIQLVMDKLREVVPDGGTNLLRAFEVIAKLNPQPDNIYLVTDSLPTLGDAEPKRSTISGKDREKLFHQSLEKLPAGLPVNVILLPMEGDPLAAPNFWYLAQISGGSFLSPSADWP